MIANISHTEQVKPLIEYNEKKVKKGEAERIHYSGFNSDADKNVVISHFALHTRDSKRKDKNMHISLNFPIEDLKKLDNIKLLEITKDYLLKLGFSEDHPFIVYRHFDTFQPHIHIVTPKITEGKKIINDSNLFLRSQTITRELEKKYELTLVSSVKNGLKKVPEDIVIKEELQDTLDKRKRYSYAVDYILKNYHPTSISEYNSQLKLVGLEVITNEYTDKDGIDRIGYKYKMEGINDLPINASTLYSNPGQKKIDRLFKSNLNYRIKREKEINDFIKNKVFAKYNILTHEIFEKELNKIDIEVKYTYKNGVVAAYRFFDKRENIHYKPSSINRDLSYGSVKQKFGTKINRNYKYHNDTLVFVLDKKYKELYPSKSKSLDPQHYVMFMAQNGMVPDVYEGKLRFNNYSNKNPKESDYASVKIPINKLDFNEISNMVHAKNYRSQVWKFQNQINKEVISEDDMKSQESNIGEILVKGFDKILDLFDKSEKNIKNKSNNPKQNL